MIRRTIGKLATRALLARLRDEAGGVAVVFGLSLVPLLGSVGVAVDAGAWYGERTRLQAAVDSAAIAAAREMRIANTTPAQLEEIAKAIATAAAQARGFAPADLDVRATVDSREHSVRLTISKDLDGVFSRILTDAFMEVAVAATARVSGSAPICAIGLDTDAPKTIHLEKSARLDASGCAVYSNSRHTQGLRIDDDARVRAALICSSGGKFGKSAAFEPAPRTDCPPLGDPLAARAQPVVGPCLEHDLVITSDRTLTPGVYCGGIRIRDDAEVTLASGLYVIKDGELRVDDGSLTGAYVSFFFTGKNAAIDFRRDATIDLSAMRDGEIPGILFFQDRAADLDYNFKIESDDARNLLGTIYLPRGDLFVNSREPVADRSAFTVIVARRLELSEGPVLTLNTDYDETDIPVPEGVGPTGDVVLSQ